MIASRGVDPWPRSLSRDDIFTLIGTPFVIRRLILIPLLCLSLAGCITPLASVAVNFGLIIVPGIAVALFGERDETSATNNQSPSRVSSSVSADETARIEGKFYALIIGNADYDQLPDLPTPVNDAKALAAVLTERYTFDEDSVTVLINATRQQIMRELSRLRKILGDEDRLLLYFAGHENLDPATDQAFWQPADAEPDSDFTWISNTEITRHLRALRAKHVLVISSVPHTWGFRGPDAFFPDADNRQPSNQTVKSRSRRVIVSGASGTLADAGSGGLSQFDHWLVKTLRENTQSPLTSSKLFERLVKAWRYSQWKPVYRTMPDSGDQGGDFIFVLR